jgi:hypothetical protein
MARKIKDGVRMIKARAQDTVRTLAGSCDENRTRTISLGIWLIQFRYGG